MVKGERGVFIFIDPRKIIIFTASIFFALVFIFLFDSGVIHFPEKISSNEDNLFNKSVLETDTEELEVIIVPDYFDLNETDEESEVINETDEEIFYDDFDMGINTTEEKIILQYRNRLLNLNENIQSVFGDDMSYEDLPIYLMKEFNNNIYEPIIYLSDVFALNVFEEEDYYNGTEFEAFKLESGDQILNYTIKFKNDISWDDIVGEEFLIFGREYEVLNSDFETKVIYLMEYPYTFVMNDYDFLKINSRNGSTNISIEGISEERVILNKNGKSTGVLSVGKVYSFGNFYLIVRESVGNKKVLLTIFSDGISISNNKLLHDSEEIDDFKVEIESDDVDEIEKITIMWYQEDDYYLEENKNLRLPYFETMNFYLSTRQLDESDDYWNFYLEAKTSRVYSNYQLIY